VNRGKTEEARAELAEIPDGKYLHKRSIDNAAKAMEDLLLERGGLGSIRRILDQFFDRPHTHGHERPPSGECAALRPRGHHGDN